MAKIVLARVDDRLIHGQVMTAWLQYTGGNHIIIVDDATAKDEFTKTIIKMAVPVGIGLDIFTIEDAAEKIKVLPDQKKLIILAKVPQIFLTLIEEGVQISEVILGGMGANKNRKKFYKNIAATDLERECIKKIFLQGVIVKIQVIPDEKSVSVEKLLE